MAKGVRPTDGGVENARRQKAAMERMVSPPSVETLAVQLQNHLDDCYAVRLETAEALKGVTSSLDEIKSLPMKAVRWLGGIIIVAAVTNIVTTYLTHEEAAQKAQAAQQAAQQAATAQQTVLGKLNAIEAHTNTTNPCSGC